MRNSWRHPAYLHKMSAVMEHDGVDESVVKVPREIMAGCVLSLVGCRTVCCHLWDAGLCVVTCGMPDCVVTCGMQDCVLSLVGCRTVLSLVGCRTVCCHLWDAGLCVVTCGMPDCVVTCARAVSKSCRRPISWTQVMVKVSYLFLHLAA